MNTLINSSNRHEFAKLSITYFHNTLDVIYAVRDFDNNDLLVFVGDNIGFDKLYRTLKTFSYDSYGDTKSYGEHHTFIIDKNIAKIGHILGHADYDQLQIPFSSIEAGFQLYPTEIN